MKKCDGHDSDIAADELFVCHAAVLRIFFFRLVKMMIVSGAIRYMTYLFVIKWITGLMWSM